MFFDYISKGSRVPEKITILDIYTARQAFTDRIISNICLVRSEFNVTDGLAKKMYQNGIVNVLISGKIDPIYEKWVIRDTVQATPLVHNEA